ncbi:MAG: AIR synthase-related protein [Thermomicrobiaceae bacterium]
MKPLPAGKLPGHLLRALLEDIDPGTDVIVGPGIGRDAAAVRLGDQILVLKTDPITFPTDDAGWYLVNINANDIACMGAEPRWLLVTALLPENQTTPELVTFLFKSLRDACSKIGCSLIGGHTEITEGLDHPILVGQMIGTATESSLIDPSTARTGDAVLLVGGIAVEGTAILAAEITDQDAGEIEPAVLGKAKNFARKPGISVVPYARKLHEQGNLDIRAMHDPTEGGLATGLQEIAESAGLGIEINRDAVHIYPETRAIAGHFGIDPWGLIASGALLCVLPQENVASAIRLLEDIDAPVSVIGYLTEDPDERTLIIDGTRERIPEFAVDEIARYFAGG